MKTYIITAVDSGDTCDGKARVLKACATYEAAREFVKQDIKQYITNANGYPLKVDWEKLSACAEDNTFGCEWNIEELDIEPYNYKKNITATEQVLIDNGIEEDEASTVLQAIGYSLLNTELYPEDDEDEEE
jgi:hypothetical protein